MICCWTLRGSLSQTSSAPKGLLSRNVAPGAASLSMSYRSRKTNWWQAMKFALLIRYVEWIGLGPKRRCDTVTVPALRES